MLEQITLKNFGPLREVTWGRLGQINLVIGSNGSGKTFLLKALYSAMCTLERYRRGDEPRSEAEILTEKLYWTFQPEKIGDLVTKGSSDPLQCELWLDAKRFYYSFGKDTSKQIMDLSNQVAVRSDHSIFLPAKEVLSLQGVILKSREQDAAFGFDDTYLDLARALRIPPTKGNNYKEFAQSRRSLEQIIGGRMEYDTQRGRWQFRCGQQKFAIGLTSEGIKKIGILDTLLGNRYLTPGSILFIDEPESALHPKAISELLDILALLAERGIQLFLASHSYFVVKKLFLVAQKRDLSIPILSEMEDGEWQAADLRDGMPSNPIINESIRLIPSRRYGTE